MDIHSNLEYLCRVCAANTKGKNSVAECVYILKTADLKDKLDKFLYLKISDNDSLPKVLCKSCFRQVEATAALSKIAKHTQQVFRDFLLSNLPKGPNESTNTSEFTSSDFTANKKDSIEKSKKDEIPITAAQMPPPPPAASMLPPPMLQPLTSATRKEEVIVNVSVSDPLTRDNQQKMISNSQRRQSLLIDSRYTPKSIAQKLTTITPLTQKVINTPTANQISDMGNITNVIKTVTPALNFYPVSKKQQQQQQKTGKQQQQQPLPPQTTQITTFSSGGYVIGRINSDQEEPKKMTLPLAPTADNILQQKRKNLVKALNNIKANNSGQVSLLKSSQQKQTAATQNLTKTPLNEVLNQVAEDELPDKIIIAAPKNKSVCDKSKKEPLNLSSKIPASLPQNILLNTPATITRVAQLSPSQQPEQMASSTNASPKPAFPEDILLGRVIRDMDLLKLILKALKWPVTKKNMELQVQRLKNSKFTDIMSDSNLFQDPDLTQLLGPYLAPVLLAAHALQQQQQQQLLTNAALNQNISTPFISPTKVSALEAVQAEINKSIPYKLPPETSVQLVPATPEEQEPSLSPPLSNLLTTASTTVSMKSGKPTDSTPVAVPQKKQRRATTQKTRDSIVISDEEDVSIEEPLPKKPRQRSSKNTAADIQIELNANFMSQFNLLTGSTGEEANEALLALLQRRKTVFTKDKKVQKRRRNSVSNLITLPPSEFDALIDLDDDIVLMEPITTTSLADSISTSSNSEVAVQKAPKTNAFVIPSVPLITRPIIKRRKTVIHSSRNRFDTSLEFKDKEPMPVSLAISAANKEKLLEETINQVAKGNISTDNNADILIQPSLIKTTNNEGSLLKSSVNLKTSAKVAAPQKKSQSKTQLGQQLLEAIGLQKLPTNINNPTSEVATSSNSLAVTTNSKQPIQQIRSALKKSLKQAQEQQLQRKNELTSSSTSNGTVIQDADSTTKTAVKEILVVEGKGNKSHNNSSLVDVEEQIDKVTLMVRKNDKDNCEQPTTTEKEEKKETKKSTVTKIQDRRRTMPALGAKGNCNLAPNDGKEKTSAEEEVQQVQQEKEEKNNERTEENNKPAKDDNENVHLSSAAVTNSNETNANAKQEIVAPKRRGRKRLVDKLLELEALANNNKTKDEDSDYAPNNKKDDGEQETTSNKTTGRPTRQSKTQSKYYKGPDKPVQGRRSLPSRTTRNRKYL